VGGRKELGRQAPKGLYPTGIKGRFPSDGETFGEDLRRKEEGKDRREGEF